MPSCPARTWSWRSGLARAAVLVLLSCSAAPAQEQTTPSASAPKASAPSAAAPAPAASTAASGVTPTADAARELLQRAAAFQRGDVKRGPPTTLHGRFHVGVRDPDGALIQAEVERWYTRSPERMLTTRTESVTGSTSTVGWDGQVAWFRDHGSGDVVIYSDAPETYAVDLELLQEQLRLTRLLLDAAVLDALIPRLVAPAVEASETVTDLDGFEHATTTVKASLPDEVFGVAPGAPPPLPGDAAPNLVLSFTIDQTTGALWKLVMTAPHRPDVASLLLCFDLHGPTRGGLRVPGNVRVIREGKSAPDATLGVEALEVDGHERLLFDVDEPIDPKLFEPPAAKR